MLFWKIRRTLATFFECFLTRAFNGINSNVFWEGKRTAKQWYFSIFLSKILTKTLIFDKEQKFYWLERFIISNFTEFGGISNEIDWNRAFWNIEEFALSVIGDETKQALSQPLCRFRCPKHLQTFENEAKKARNGRNGCRGANFDTNLSPGRVI